jgi:hypothetical protein
MNELLREVATVVPAPFAFVARYSKKPRRHSLILDVWRRMSFREKNGPANRYHCWAPTGSSGALGRLRRDEQGLRGKCDKQHTSPQSHWPLLSTPRRDLKLKQRYCLQHANVPFAGFALRRIDSARKATCEEATGSGKVATACARAVVIASIASGENAALEKSFIPQARLSGRNRALVGACLSETRRFLGSSGVARRLARRALHVLGGL